MRRTILSFLIILCTALAAQAQPAPIYTLKSCLEQGLLNNYSLRITRNEQQVSKNNATLANAGYLPTLDLSAGYRGTLDNTETKLRATGETTKENGVFDQTIDAGINLSWTIFDGFNITANYQKLKELERQGETNTRIAIVRPDSQHRRRILQLCTAQNPSEQLPLCRIALQGAPAHRRRTLSHR